MKNKKTELNVDFIGSQNTSLSLSEEKKISEYIRLQKIKATRKVSRKINIIEDKKMLV